MKKFKISSDRRYLINEKENNRIVIPIYIDHELKGRTIDKCSYICFPLVGAEFVQNRKGELILRKTKNTSSVNIRVIKYCQGSFTEKILFGISKIIHCVTEPSNPFSRYSTIVHSQNGRYSIIFTTYKEK